MAADGRSVLSCHLLLLRTDPLENPENPPAELYRCLQAGRALLAAKLSKLQTKNKVLVYFRSTFHALQPLQALQRALP